MYTHIVLLRGVNVGKAKRVPMADFKRILHRLGCGDVRTLLNSGNAAVSHPAASPDALAKAVATTLHASFGFKVPVVVKSVHDLRAIVAGNKLLTAAMNHSRFLVVFAQRSKDLQALKSISKTAGPPDQFLLGAKAAYLHCPDGILNSDAAAAILGKMGDAVTTRNWATVLKLDEIASGRGA